MFPRESIIPKEFVAEEDLHRGEKKSVDAANEDEDTVRTSEENPSDGSIRRGPLTFDPNPPEAEEEGFPLSAADDQAKLMHWHYRLGHLTFAKLKQLALHGKIPKKLALLDPPKCAGCLFGAMTKIPWRGKEPKSSHKVFTATKPGETVSVDQMVSTEVGFFAGNSPRSGTDAAPSLSTITPDCVLCTTKLMIPPSKLSPPSTLLRSSPP